MPEKSTNAIDQLVALVNCVPPFAKQQVIADLAKDRELNPNGIAPDEITRRLGEIDSEKLLAEVSRASISRLMSLSNEAGIADSKGIWQEAPNPRSMMGQAVIQLRGAAKEMIATLTQLKEGGNR